MTDDGKGNKQQGFQVSFAEIDKVFSLFEKLADAVKNAINLPKEERKSLNQILSETAEMLDIVLNIVELKISTIIISIRGNKSDIKQQIIELEYASEWEKQCRKFMLCEPLARKALEIDRGFFSQIKSYFIFSDKKELKETIEQFISNEFVVGVFISKMFKSLTKLDKKVDKEPDFVLKQFEKAKVDIKKCRNKFFELQKQISVNI